MTFALTQLTRYAQVYLPVAARMANFWFHATEDAAASVATAGYFNLARHKLKVGDVIISKSGITATEVLQFLDVTAVPASGDITVAVHSESGVVGGLTAVADLAGSLTGTPDGTMADVPVPTDTPASADALRDDIATNIIPAINVNLEELQAKVNAILARLRTAGILAT